MPRLLPEPNRRFDPSSPQPDWQSGTKYRPRYGRKAAALIILTLLVHPACLFHKKKGAVPEAAPPAPSRIVLLPLNVPTENPDLQWVAMAAPIHLAKIMQAAPDLEVVPIWQSMPIAAEAVGATREVTPENAAYVASRVAAKWAVEGQLSPSKDGTSLLLDFVPTKATMIAYRYQKIVKVDALGAEYYEAVAQFLRYLVARPMEKASGQSTDAASLKQLAETLNVEYGWFAAADPGKAEGVVSGLVRSDPKMARLLFDPGMYPAVGPVPSKPRPVELTPTPPLPAAKPAAEPAPSPEAKKPATASNTEAGEPQIQLQVPPPQRFVQKLTPRQPRRGEGIQVAESADVPSPTPSPPAARKKQRAPAANSTTQVSFLPPKPKPSIVSTKGFKVQVLALRDKNEAESAARRLEQEGLRTEVEPLDLKEKGTLYRIRIVGYESRQDAEKAAEKLISLNMIQQYWIVPEY